MVGLLGIRLPRVLTCGVRSRLLLSASPACSRRRCGQLPVDGGQNAIMPAFVVVVIGGLGSFAGAVIAGLMVGVVIALTIQFQPDAADAMMYVFMAACCWCARAACSASAGSASSERA